MIYIWLKRLEADIRGCDGEKSPYRCIHLRADYYERSGTTRMIDVGVLAKLGIDKLRFMLEANRLPDALLNGDTPRKIRNIEEYLLLTLRIQFSWTDIDNVRCCAHCVDASGAG